MALIELTDVTFTYPDSLQPAITNLSLRIEKGQFVVLFGASGSGKSTLLKLLKNEIRPHGTLTGNIVINGSPIQDSSGLSQEIGFVFQDPENQIVADDVLHELVFGLENIGLTTNEMRNRVAEMVHFFGADDLLRRKSHELSGGKKQQINLASALLMQPNILLLDEPTSQLDPVSTRELLDMLKRLNEEFGMTIVLAEHRLEEVFTLADTIIMMEKGEVLIAGEPRQVLPQIWNSKNRAYVPGIPSLFLKMHEKGLLPLTVKEGRNWIATIKPTFLATETEKQQQQSKNVIKTKGLSFRYEKSREFVLDELDFALNKGEFYALLGGNGSGKSTLIKALAGLVKSEQGKIWIDDKPIKSYKNNDFTKYIGYLPQNPKLFFLQDTVERELHATMEQFGLTDWTETEALLEELGIVHLKTNHPYDLSGGEIQKAALACVLLRKPKVLLLDEPTKGLDPISKKNLANILLSVKSNGVSILMSTHDVEFAAQHATKCGMMFQGKITSEDNPERFFNGNFFYTTMIQRIFRGQAMMPLTLEEAAHSCVSTIS
ncbi:ABC transporter ATP-binding protein [Neobacillus niacini]|uniref:ABC transporter ATP-binding protein n=1 Tax=Neobacillus niacini TaxID=86668 RepID=UPI0021CAF042|nr:energy-coupling factor transporter ATPase [Neobacillus niacini]MCM3764314.1 energy-coupling factor transporter ATPase [Neobacillus niacini]